MSLHSLRKIYEKRRNVLDSLLKKDGKLDKSRKEQLVGAIQEIDTLMKTIDSMRDDEIRDSEKLGSKIHMKDPGFMNKINIFKNINTGIQLKLDNTKTFENLLNVFIRKCDTRTRYEAFAKKAKDEGYESIAHVFNEFANQEKEHAMIIFKQLNLPGTTFNNIKEASDIENMYHQKIYTTYEQVAKEENMKEIANLFKELSEIEAEHEKKFLKMLKIFHENKMFKSEVIVKWKCRNCGYMSESKEAPKKCVVCKRGQAFFEMHKE